MYILPGISSYVISYICVCDFSVGDPISQILQTNFILSVRRSHVGWLWSLLRDAIDFSEIVHVFPPCNVACYCSSSRDGSTTLPLCGRPLYSYFIRGGRLPLLTVVHYTYVFHGGTTTHQPLYHFCFTHIGLQWKKHITLATHVTASSRYILWGGRLPVFYIIQYYNCRMKKLQLWDRGFCRNSSLQSAWDTWIARTTGFV